MKDELVFGVNPVREALAGTVSRRSWLWPRSAGSR